MRNLLLAPLALGAALPAGPAARPAPAFYTVALRCATAVNGHDFRIHLTRSAEGVGVRYERRLRVRQPQLSQDPEANALQAILTNPAAPWADKKEAGRRFVTKVDAYTVFRRDSLWLPAAQVPAFVQLLDSVSQASPAQLEAGRRIVLDGTSVYLIVRPTGGQSRETFAHQPTPTSYPLVYRLLRQSLGLCRARRSGARTLPASYTDGY